MKHKHADLMMMYAEDALTTERPWELWELKDFSGYWVALCKDFPFFLSPDVEFRRKPRTININGYEVPGPEREPLEKNTPFYSFDITCDSDVYTDHWEDHKADLSRLNMGTVHKTIEAAELHLKALLSFTKKGKS